MTATPRLRLVRAELFKIRTTSIWWVFGLLTLAATAVALLVNVLQAGAELSHVEQQRSQQAGKPTDASLDITSVVARSAANVYTSGQFFGLLFMVVLGALIVTNEYFHQTATTTFLATPRRSRVVAAKLAAAAVVAVGFWAAITVVDLAVGSAFLTTHGYDPALTDWTVVRSVLMNLLAFVVWAILGMGFGVLLRSQLGATLTGSALYLLSLPIALVFFGLLRRYVVTEDWIWQWVTAVPGVASFIMVSPDRLTLGNPGSEVLAPPWWVGGLTLVGYAVLAGLVGTVIARRRDIA